MQISDKLSCNELHKAGLLIVRAGLLGMDISGYGEIAVNPNSGNVYLWCEDYQFSLYIPPAGNQAIMACFSCYYDGEETIHRAGKSLHSLEKWANRLQLKSERKEAKNER